MKAAEIMATNVIAAAPGASVYEVMAIMVTHRISGMPVVKPDAELVGIVSEGDLMRRFEAGTRHRHSLWFRVLWGPDEEAAESIKENARRIEDVMTREVVTAAPDTDLADIADLLEGRRIKRVPIVQDRKVVGIVTRLDLVRAALMRIRECAAPPPANDEELRQRIVERLKSEAWAATELINLNVRDGEVEIWGMVDSPVEKKALRIAVESVPGVRAVEDHTAVRPAAMGGV
jgi:CBS-domain-containing membrane protein